MNSLRYIATLILGVAVAAVIKRPAAQASSVEETILSPDSYVPSFSQKFHSEDHLRNSLKIPMESRLRDTLKNELMEEWARSDPKGFLQALTDRAWPRELGHDPARTAMEELAKISPESLLEYARTEGCDHAWFTYLAAMPPLTALNLLYEVNQDELPEGWLAKLVQRGMEIDPEFHRHLEQIRDPSLRQEALAATATSMLASRRITELGPLIEMLDPKGKHHEELIEFASRQMMVGDLRLTELDAIPEEFASEVLAVFLNHDSGSIDIVETLQSVDDMIATGWAQGREKDLCRFVDQNADVDVLRYAYNEKELADLREEFGKKFFTLSEKVPGELEEIKMHLTQKAIQFHPPQPAELYKQITDAKIRDSAMAYLATFDPSAVEAIDSPLIRDRTKRYLAWKEQLPGDSDPFAPEPEYDEALPWERQVTEPKQ